ncbi:hypothetical protein K488DRAFT_71559 [Vararia minispora EC-137]|uniref:Uncharacterized protein n=1 Tax=Vararia minispora EC-137 TaxID=1314806 RepID=A0ACB8QHV7_9AGAM|nr:hypothetical protein K488DRAFT_71559 [Vararia minispora EC-137]
MISPIQLLAVLSMHAITLVDASPANCTRNYTVKPGDTCDAIAAAQSASTYQILSVNSPTVNSGCTNIFPGEVICLAIEGQDCQPVAVVQDGDSCSSIASGAAINISTLLANNPNLGSNLLLKFAWTLTLVASPIVYRLSVSTAPLSSRALK